MLEIRLKVWLRILLRTRDMQDLLVASHTYVNGNLVSDATGFTVTAYNYLDLPVSLTSSDGSTIQNVYDADGKKLKTIVTPVSGSM
jgi:hypothetical protein